MTEKSSSATPKTYIGKALQSLAGYADGAPKISKTIVAAVVVLQLAGFTPDAIIAVLNGVISLCEALKQAVSFSI